MARLPRFAMGCRFALIAAAGLCSACALAADPSAPALSPDPLPDVPTRFDGDVADGAHVPLAWWRAFADPVLDGVVEAVLASNFDLAAGLARVQQARVRGRLADAVVLPTVRARAGADTFDVPTNAGVGAQLRELGLDDAFGNVVLPDRLGLTTYSIGADFAYELDLWDRVRHTSLAAGAELLATEADAHAARIGVLTETITAYFDIVDLRRQIAIAQQTLGVLEERERLAATRYDRGLTDSLDLYRVREDARNTQSGLPQLRNRLAGAEARLAVLLGGYRADVAELLPDALAPTPAAESVPPGIPADLLLQRPDVRAAGQRLQAAGHDIDARRAELLPSLSFSGSIGLQTTDASRLFDPQQWFANLLSNLFAPVIDGGRRAGNVALSHARFNELAAEYGRTVVTAVNEVEAALAGQRNEGRRHALLAARREEARATLNLRSRRYSSGLGGYADVLDASRTLLNVESAVADAERSLALARLAVHRALGGAWTVPDPAAAAPTAVSFPGQGGDPR